MKRMIFALLATVLLFSSLALTPTAEGTSNREALVKYNGLAYSPSNKMDGRVKDGEYAAMPLCAYPENADQFVSGGCDECDIEFGVDVDEEYLYLSWLVCSGHFTPDGSDGYPRIDLIITPEPAKDGDTSFGSDGNYFHAGYWLTEDNEQVREVFNTPNSFDVKDVSVNIWDAVLVCDTESAVLTCETRIPWEMLGIEFGADITPGMAFSVSVPDGDGEGDCKISWQDVFSDTVNPDRAANVNILRDDRCGLTADVNGESQASESLAESETSESSAEEASPQTESVAEGGDISSSETQAESNAESEAESSEAGMLSLNSISREASVIISVAVVFIMALASINLVRKKKNLK